MDSHIYISAIQRQPCLLKTNSTRVLVTWLVTLLLIICPSSYKARLNNLIGANFLLQQDNDPKHTSKLCKKYLGKKQAAGMLFVIEWPAQSPDLNPIELLWEQLDRMVRKKCPSSQSNLWEVLQEAWGEISTDYLNKLTARMPKVCNAVIAANGAFFDESTFSSTKLLFQA